MKSYQSWGDEWVRAGWRVQRHVTTGATRMLDARGVVQPGTTIEEARHAAPQWHSSRAVILLHALAGTPSLLSGIASRLELQGLASVNLAYPSLNEGMNFHAARVSRIVEELARDGIEEVSFIGHSMGGLVARAVATRMPVTLGHIAYFGTPNHGALLGQRLHRLSPYRAVFGPAGFDVLPDRVAHLPVPDTAMLVIAGGNGYCGFNPLLSGDDDGIVTVAETKFENAQYDFMRVTCLHRWLPRHVKAADTVVDFIVRDTSRKRI